MRAVRPSASGLQVTDFPSEIEWSFAKDLHVKERNDSLSYDDLESRDEGETHRWLREVARDSLERLNYRVYDAGVGFRGHNSFCDGAAKRGDDFVVYEALRRWAILDKDQLLRKLEFARHCTLLLITTRWDRKSLKFRVDRLAAEYNFPILLSWPEKSSDGSWKLNFPLSQKLSEAAKFRDSPKYKLEIEEKRTWVEFRIAPMESSGDYFFLYYFRRFLFDFYGKKGGATNPRSRRKTANSSEFIIRKHGREIARFQEFRPLNTEPPKICGRLRRTELPTFIELIKTEAEKGHVFLEVVSSSET